MSDLRTDGSDGGVAFPQINDGSHLTGMSLRDFFAAKAMHAVLADPNLHPSVGAGDIARMAYAQADAMLDARK